MTVLFFSFSSRLNKIDRIFNRKRNYSFRKEDNVIQLNFTISNFWRIQSIKFYICSHCKMILLALDNAGYAFVEVFISYTGNKTPWSTGLRFLLFLWLRERTFLLRAVGSAQVREKDKPFRNKKEGNCPGSFFSIQYWAKNWVARSIFLYFYYVWERNFLVILNVYSDFLWQRNMVKFYSLTLFHINTNSWNQGDLIFAQSFVHNSFSQQALFWLLVLQQ